jgi:hypothetical protein
MSSLLEAKAEAGNAANAGESPAPQSAAPEAEKPTEAAPAASTPEAPPQAEAKPEVPKPKAPEKYDFKLPEGAKVDEGLLSKFEGALRAADIPQEHATKIFELGTEWQASLSQAMSDALEAKSKAWREEAEKLPEFSEKTRKDTVASIRAFLSDEKVLGAKADEFIGVINESGLGVHPGLLKTLATAAKLYAEDVAVLGGAGAKKVGEIRELYDHSDHV